MRHLFKLAAAACLFAALTLPAFGVKAAEKTFFDRTNNKELKYTKQELNCILNGEELVTNSAIIYGSSGSAFAGASDFFSGALNTKCIFKLSDASVSFESSKGSVTLFVGKAEAVINGSSSALQEAPRVLQDSNGVSELYVPTKAIATTLGMSYKWTEATNTITIDKQNEVQLSNAITEKPFVLPLLADLKAEDVQIDENFVMWKTANSSKGVEKYTRQIIVTIPGSKLDYREYLNRELINTYSTITGLAIERTADNHIKFIFDTSVIRVCQPQIKDSELLLSFVHPTEVYDKIVVIDAGHGGVDYGATREGYTEAKLNLAMAYTNTKDLFEAKGIKVYYTRTDNTLVTLYQRRMLAAEVGADLFVSVHQNADNAESSSYRGTCVIYSKYNNAPNASGLTSKLLAEELAKSITDSIGTKLMNKTGATNFKELDVTTLSCAVQDVLIDSLPETGFEKLLFGKMLTEKTYTTRLIPSKTAPSTKLTFAVLHEIPSVLIEVGILSNSSDLAILIDEENQKKVGKSIVDTLADLFEKYPTTRMASFKPATTD